MTARKRNCLRRKPLKMLAACAVWRPRWSASRWRYRFRAQSGGRARPRRRGFGLNNGGPYIPHGQPGYGPPAGYGTPRGLRAPLPQQQQLLRS